MMDGEAQAVASEQISVDDALTFLREMVEPTVAEFLERPDDRRRGCLACLCLASMADHYFHARPGSRDGCDNADAFRRYVGGLNGAVKQVIGVANATKHVERRRGRVGYQDVSAQQINLGNMRCGWPFTGTQVMVEVEDGYVWLLSDLVEAAVAFWRDRVTT
jgi:hypothetical protein